MWYRLAALLLFPCLLAAQTQIGGGGGNTTLTNSSFVNGGDFLFTDLNHGQIITDASWGNASSTINSAGMAQWTNGIVGATVFGTDSCQADAINTATGLDTIAAVIPQGTVSAVNSATQIVVSTTSTKAVASHGCIVIGQLQDTGMTSITSAVNGNTTTCPTVNLPAGVFLISAFPGFMTAQPTSCANNGLVLGGEIGGFGGYTVKGVGSSSTIFAIVPSLVPDARCNHGLTAAACFVLPNGAQWRGFRITGSGIGMSARSDAKNLVEFDNYVSVNDVILDQWGTGDTGTIGLDEGASGGFNYFTDLVIDAFGNSAASFTGSTNQFLKTTIQNVCGTNMITNTSGTIYSIGGNIWQNYPLNSCSTPTANRTNLNILGGTVTLKTGDVLVGGFNNTTNSNVVLVASGATFNASGNITTQAGTSNASWAIQNNGSTTVFPGTLVQNNSNIGMLVGATGTTYDNGVVINITNNGKYFGSNRVSFNQVSIGNIGLTSGWGTSSVASVATNSDPHQGKFTITGAAGAASPVLTLTFPVAYLVAPPQCTLFETGASDLASLTSVSTTSTSTTNAVFTFVGTPVAVTYVFSYICGP